jgi:hypothetical protein
MRIINSISLLILLSYSGSLFAEDEKVNFSGEWMLDAEKSEISESRGGRRGRATTKIVVLQEENKLTVESTGTNRDGEERTRKANYTLDGED